MRYDREGVGCASWRVVAETLRMAFQRHASCVWKVSARHTARGAAHDGVETCACMLGSWVECDARVGGPCVCLPHLWVHARPAPGRAPGVARRVQSHPPETRQFNTYIHLIYTENHHSWKNWWGSAPPLAPLHAHTAFARPALSHTASPTPIEMPRGRGRPSWGHNASHFTSSMMGSLVQPTRPLASATTARRGARHHEGHSRRVAHV